MSVDDRLLRHFFNLPLIGMAVSSPETRRWLRVNDRLCQILGYPADELARLTWADITHPDDLAADNAEFERMLAGHSEGYVLEKRFLRKDGADAHTRMDVRCLRRDDASVETVLATVQDITELVRSREGARETAERLSHVMRANPTIIYTLRPAAGHGPPVATYVSENIERILGFTVSEALEPGWWVARLHPADREAALARSATLAAGQELIHEYRFRRKDGSVVWVQDQLRLLPATDGHEAEIVGSWTDVNERKESDHQRSVAEERFRGLVEQALAGIYILDAERIVYANPRAAQIFGYGPDELTGQPVRAVVSESDWPRIAHAIDCQLAGGNASEFLEFHGRRKDGTEVIIGAHGTLKTLDAGPVIIGALQDITDKVRNEQKLQEYVVRLEQAMTATVDAISNMVGMRDPYTAGHERRVGELAAAIGREMGLDEHARQGLRVAGGVHDVGKITIPAEILSKPGRLTPLEYELVQGHVEQGYEILKGIAFPWPIAEAVRQHHERMDGSGYPRGLKGEEILLAARIIAVADTVASMAYHRPYRPALGIDRALEEVTAGAGPTYDSQVVAACRRLFRDRGYQMKD